MHQKTGFFTGQHGRSQAGASTLLHCLLVLLLTGTTCPGLGINYRQDFAGFVFEPGTHITSFGQQGEWILTASGNADTRLDYKGAWGSGTAAGFRGNDLVLGYQHTTTTGELKVTLHLPNTTGEYIGMVNIAYTGRVMRPTMGRTPAWKVKVNGQPVGALSYSTAEGEDVEKSAAVQVSILAGENLVIEWSCDNGEGSGYSRQIGIAGVEVTTGEATQAAAPVFEPPPGAYESPIEVQITAPTPGSVIYYTLNGSTPTPEDHRYEESAVYLEKSTTLRAVAIHDDLEASEVTTGIYTLAEQTVLITGVDNPEGISADQGTRFEDLELPARVFTHFDGAPSDSMAVDWIKGDYNEAVAAVYTLSGTIRPQEGVSNPDNIQPGITVTLQEVVLTYRVTFGLLLASSLGFDPQQDKVFITGSMFDWAVAGTLPEQQQMEHQGDLNFSKTMDLEPGSYSYRYYFNAGLSNPEAGPERTLLVAGPMQVTDLWGATSAHGAEQMSMTAYPNPATSSITFEAAVPIHSITLYGMRGEKHSDQQVQQKAFTLDTSRMPPGLYLALVMAGGQVRVMKIRIGRW